MSPFIDQTVLLCTMYGFYNGGNRTATELKSVLEVLVSGKKHTHK
jgi:hypothetical protein